MMAYEEQEAKRSRVVVETPTARREFVESESVRTPDRGGVSAGTVGVIVVLAVALVTILVLLLLSGQSTDPNANLAAQETQQTAPVPQTTIIQQPAPAQQPPVVVQQPVPVAVPVIVTPPSGATRGPNDADIEAAIQKRFADDAALAGLGITATVVSSEVTLLGSVKSEEEKALVQRAVERIKGVTKVDNQISVIP
jgi:hypothetical protein